MADGARSAVAMLNDDGGLIIDRNFKYQICFESSQNDFSISSRNFFFN